MKRFSTALFVLGAVILTMAALVAVNQTATAATKSSSKPGAKVENFTLADYRGTEHAFADLAGKQATVVAFLGTECPLAKSYGPRLAELAAKYAVKASPSSASTRTGRTRSPRSRPMPAPRASSSRSSRI